MEQFADWWEGLEDPRSGNAGLHDFHQLLRIARCPVRCGGQGAVDIAAFAKAKEPLLLGVLKLANDVPSHDTFSRLFRQLDPARFRTAFQRVMARVSEPCQGVVAIAGKVLRRAFERASAKAALHLVSAWGCEQRRVLAQIPPDAKSNESTAGPKLRAMLLLEGTIVTTDALNCQRRLAQQIVDQGGAYALALKGNQTPLHGDVVRFFDDPASTISTAKPHVDADHGRSETRTATVSTALEWLQDPPRWPGLKAIGKRARMRATPAQTTTEMAYCLLSAPLLLERWNAVVRSHGGVENQLHWRLDVVMNEDQDRTRWGHGPETLAVLRQRVINAMQKDGSKGALRGKFKRAGWNDASRTRLLALFCNAIALRATPSPGFIRGHRAPFSGCIDRQLRYVPAQW